VLVIRRPNSIVEAFLTATERAPDRECIRFDGRRLTYGDVSILARKWATAFRDEGLGSGGRVALYLDNGVDFVAAYLGVQAAGGVAVLVNTQYRQVELRHILADAGVGVCVVGGQFVSELERVQVDLPLLKTVVVVGSSNSSPDLCRSARLIDVETFLARGHVVDLTLPTSESTALIGYTSGTTGQSKGAMLSHRNLATNSIAVTEAWHWTSDDVLLLTLPLFHIHGLGVGLHGTFVSGSAVDLRKRFDAAETYDDLRRGDATMFFGVPTMYSRLIAEARSRPPATTRVRLFVSGSAPLSAQTFAEFEQWFGHRILERYGMTETVMNLTNPYEGERRPGTVGQPFPGQAARIVDLRTRLPIDDERPGEIQVRGPHVFSGYWQRPDATAEAFDATGWFSTGDLGWRSRDGYYTISGRARELIITGGYNVYPREVEEVLQTHPNVAEAAVYGVPDPEFGEHVVAAIVIRGATRPTADEIVTFCRDNLASYKKPRQIHFVERLPRNALGKVQKHVLRDQLA
jgi:malonyl-CoA/methylmalonyl-CoA synthetase